MNWFNNFFSKVFQGPSEDSNQDSQATVAVSSKPQNTAPVDDEYLLELEESLLTMDCGIDFAEFITKRIREKGSLKIYEAENFVRELCFEVLTNANPSHSTNEALHASLSQSSAEQPLLPHGLEIILIVGVNGVGKTTSIGKLSKRFASQGKKVMIAPCDTFRAAAPEQLMMWAERAGAVFYQSQAAKKADAILFEAIQKAKAENFDVLMVDTAGRLQNKKSLMEELSKLSMVIEKHAKGIGSFSRLLVLDST
ncbi:MAG: hypothetical protein SFU25_00375, partial [Candidatus Caenarcaniphilales bacterium]|nr:hypothetical protein [Candidatus Caenarcaniphilales bacterium]